MLSVPFARNGFNVRYVGCFFSSCTCGFMWCGILNLLYALWSGTITRSEPLIGCLASMGLGGLNLGVLEFDSGLVVVIGLVSGCGMGGVLCGVC